MLTFLVLFLVSRLSRPSSSNSTSGDLRSSTSLSRRWLTSIEERRSFLAAYGRAARSHHSASDRLDSCPVRAFYRDGELVGGYALNDRSPYFYVGLVPDSHRDAMRWPGGTTNDCVEVGCMWVAPRGVSQHDRVRIYASLIWDAFRSGRRYIVAGTASEGLARIQGLVLRRPIYQGPTVHVSMPTQWIYYATRAELVACALIALPTQWVRRHARLACCRLRPRRRAIAGTVITQKA